MRDPKKAHCAALGRTVDIAVANQPGDDSEASPAIEATVCLDRGPLCTGATCPLTGATLAVMTLRLARRGMASSSDAAAE